MVHGIGSDTRGAGEAWRPTTFALPYATRGTEARALVVTAPTVGDASTTFGGCAS
jgi:hypothetical protein